MKTLIITAITASCIALSGCDSLVPDIQNNQLIEPDYEYELDTWGENSEIYEFTPKANSDFSCVMFMLDSGAAMGLQCFPKTEKGE